jgi:7tm Odorant receptor.
MDVNRRDESKLSNVQVVWSLDGSVDVDRRLVDHVWTHLEIFVCNKLHFPTVFLFQVQKNMRPVVISTCFCFISLVALSAQIMLKSQYKLAYSFCFILLILHVVKLAEFSNGIETCNRQIPSMLYFDFDWYTKSKSMKNMVSFIIRRSQKSEHYAFFGGFVTFHRPLLLSLMSKTYTFINWLIYMNRH